MGGMPKLKNAPVKRARAASPRRRSARLNPPPRATFQDLPPEILHIILKPLPTSPVHRPSASREYLSRRLVNKAFAQIIATYAFSDIEICDGESSLDRLIAIASNPSLAKFLKHYTYHFMPAIVQERDVSSHYHAMLEGIPVPDGMAKQVKAYECKMKFEINTTLYHGHVRYLSALPNLRTLSITVERGDQSMYPQRSPVCFRSILVALAERAKNKSVRPVEQLTIAGLCEVSFSHIIQDTIVEAEAGLKQITRLRLSLSLPSRYDLDVPHDAASMPGWTKILGRFIRGAYNLEELQIGNCKDSCGSYAPPMLDWSVLVGCACGKNKRVHTWPKLTKLDLCNFSFPRELIVRWLKAQTAASPFDSLNLKRCNIKWEYKPNPQTLDQTSQAPEDIDAAKVFYTWASVLRALKPAVTSVKRLTFANLSDGPRGARHMKNQEAMDWVRWIKNEKTPKQRRIRVMKEAEPEESPTARKTMGGRVAKGRKGKAGKGQTKKAAKPKYVYKEITEYVDAPEPTGGYDEILCWCKIHHHCLGWNDVGYSDMSADDDSDTWTSEDEDGVYPFSMAMSMFPYGGPYEEDTEDESDVY